MPYGSAAIYQRAMTLASVEPKYIGTSKTHYKLLERATCWIKVMEAASSCCIFKFNLNSLFRIIKSKPVEL